MQDLQWRMVNIEKLMRSDGSFLKLQLIVVVTNIDLEHVDFDKKF